MTSQVKLHVMVPPGALGIKVSSGEGKGVKVIRVKPDSQCKNLLHEGDVIQYMDGEEISSPMEFAQLLSLKRNEKRGKNLGILRIHVEASESQDEADADEDYLVNETRSQRQKRLGGEKKKAEAKEEASMPRKKHKKKKRRKSRKRYNSSSPLIFVNRDPKNANKLCCDICRQPDNHFGMHLQKCSTCNVAVHEECYGLVNSTEGGKYANWKCHACSIVGRTIEIRKGNGRTTPVKIHRRPTKCALCPVFEGNHAMHPLYDKHGKGGQPIICSTKFDGDEILMVHTLCAVCINNNKFSKNLVYGCSRDGNWLNDIGYETDDGSNAHVPPLDLSHWERSGSLEAAVNHFVIAYNDERLLEYKHQFQSLTCKVCNEKNDSRQIPIQCAEESCRKKTPVHVGCARWKMGADGARFFPGTEHLPCIGRVYCKEHARREKAKEISHFRESSESESSTSDD